MLGVCGGYQMLGQTLADPAGSESGRAPDSARAGAAAHPHHLHRPEAAGAGHGRSHRRPFAGAALTGYEIHTGRTEVEGLPFCTQADGTPEGCVQDRVFGTYLHGLFDTGELTEKLVAALCARKGIAPDTTALMPMEQYRQQQFDLLAEGVRKRRCTWTLCMPPWALPEKETTL